MADQATIATAYVQLVPTLSGVQGKIGEAFAGSEQEAEEAGKKVGGSFGGSMLDTLKVVAGPAAIAGALAGLFAIGSTFDDVSDSIRTATGKTGDELDGLVDQAKTIGTTIPVEFDKIGPALSKVSQKLDLTGSDLETVTSQFLALGNITGKDINMDTAAASFSAFGVKGAEVSGQLDNLFKISQQTGTGIDEITGSIQKSAPALQAMGFGFTESAALVGQLDKAGLNVQGTLGGMGKALVNAAKSGEAPKETFDRVTGSIGDLVSQGKDAEAINMAASLFGTKGAAQFVEATKNGSLNVQELTGAVAASSETILGAQEDTGDFAESWQLFSNKAMVAIEPVATAVFNFAGQAMGALLDAFDNVGGAVDAVTGFFRDYRDVLIAAGVVVLALTSNIIAQTVATIAQNVATKAVSLATKAWAVAQAALNLVMDANPIMLVVAAVGALVAAAIWAYQNVGWFRDIVDNAWTVISTAATWAWENVIKPVFDALSGAVSSIIDWFSHFGENLSGILSSIGGWISDAWNSILTFFTDLPTNIWNILVTAAETIASFGWEFIKWYYGGIWNAAVMIFDFFVNLAPMVWEKIVAAAGWLLERGKEFIGWLKDGIVQGAQLIWDWVTAMPGAIWTLIYSSINWYVDRGKELIGWLKDGIVAGAEAIWTWISSIPGKIWEKVIAFKDMILGYGSQIGTWIADGVKTAAQAIADAVTGLFDLKLNDEGTGYVTVGPNDMIAGAHGLVVPGVDPGHDNVLMKARSGEAVMVPEWTDQVGGAGSVYRWNRAAERGNLLSVMADDILGYAAGGIVEKAHAIGKSAGEGMAGTFKDRKTTGLFGRMFSDFAANILKAVGATPNAAGFNDSQDPSSFGWVRASGINTGYAWNGRSFPGGVAAGTEALWNGLLNELVPQIPGGLQPGALWGYENRSNVNSPGNASFHSYGLALDVNSSANPNGAPGYGRAGQYVIPAEAAHNLAATYGMLWGGDFRGTPDPMHFEIHLSPNDLGAPGPAAAAGSGGILGKLFSTIKSKLAGPAASGNVPPAVAGGVFDGLVERWRPTVLQALGLIGQPANLADTVLNQIRTESSGDPRAINLTDSNAMRGTPSKGLIQAIDSTFQAYRLANLPNDIYNPLSNIVAGIRYAISRYGSITAGMRGVAYDDGGWLMPQQAHPVNLLRQPEPVLSPRQWSIAEQALDEISGHRSRVGVQMTVHQLPGQSPADLAREIDRRLAFAGGRSA